VRRNDGQVVEADRTESTLMLGTASGGVIGLLIGIIGGPLGMLDNVPSLPDRPSSIGVNGDRAGASDRSSRDLDDWPLRLPATAAGFERPGRDHPKCVTTAHLSDLQAAPMTNEHPTSNQPTTTRWDGHNVIVVRFDVDYETYHALTVLKELDFQQRVGVQEAVVVSRGEDGQLVEKDRIESGYLPPTASGGLIGLLLGVIGGPFGVLIGGATGLMVGSLYDRADYEETDSALGAISSLVRAGRTALLAVVVEQSPEVVDAAMAGVGGMVVRRPVAEVEAEIAVAEEAERKAKREARNELLHSRHEHDKAAVNAKIEELNAKVRHG
jgi:uncharacterized membrane protein